MAYQIEVGLNLGAANSGLTLEAQLVNTAGANVGSAVTTGFVEFGASGNYLWNYASMPDSHQGGIIFRLSGGGAVKTFVAINPQEVEFTDVKTSTRSSHTAADVWTSPTRTLSSFGTLATDIATAVWSSLTRTLTGSVSVDVAAIAAAVWAYTTRTLTIPLTQLLASLNGNTIEVIRGDTMTIPLAGMGDITGATKAWFTVKRQMTDSDADAILQIEMTDGLITLNGAAGTAGDGDLVIADFSAGDINVTLEPDSSALLPLLPRMTWDCQVLIGTTVRTLGKGPFKVDGDVTGAVS